MAVHEVYANSGDGGVESAHATYATARAGANLTANSTDVWHLVGQQLTSGVYRCNEIFEEFEVTSFDDDDLLLVSAELRLFVATVDGTSEWPLVARNRDWGGTVSTSDYVPGATLGSLTTLAPITMVASMTAQYYAGGTSMLLDQLATEGALRLVWSSDRMRQNLVPGAAEKRALVYSTDNTGTGQDPMLRVLTVAESTLTYVCGASVQLSDGTHVWLDNDGLSTPAVTLLHRDGDGDQTTVATVATGTGSDEFYLSPGLQGLALTRDASDNLYVVGPRGSAPETTLLGKAYDKGGGHTWTAKAAVPLPVPTHQFGRINNVAAAWHATGGAGHLMVLLSGHAARGRVGQVRYATVSCTDLLAGSGDGVVDTGSDPTWLGLSSGTLPLPARNETGTMLDVTADGLRSVGVTADTGTTAPGGRVTLNADGTVGATAVHGSNGSVEHDAEAKLRVLALDSGRVASVADGHVIIRNYDGTLLGFANIIISGPESVPTSFKNTACWDAVHDPGSNKLWLYYLDVEDPLRLLRTSINLSTYQAVGDEVEVNSSVGASGSTALAVRVPRIVVDERAVRVEVAVVSAAGTLSTSTTIDSFNVAPSASTLAAVPTFDAGTTQTFSWTFADPNSFDTQTAYELEIDNASTSASAYRSGKTTSGTSAHLLAADTLSNNTSYRWRVRTYDDADAAGAWSAYGEFQTTSAGVVAVTDPAVDNPDDLNVSQVTVTWEVTSATQAQYRVKVVAVTAGTTHTDTGFVVSTDTTYTITQLLSDVEYRIEVTIKDGLGVSSSIGTRLVTPSYSAPEQPVITVTANDDDGYILVAVSNPDPTGDNPDVSSNEVWRSPADADEYILIGTAGPDGEYRDYAAGTGTWDYFVRGVV